MKGFRRATCGVVAAAIMVMGSTSAMAAYQPGIYEGTADGFLAPVKTSVEIRDNQITSITVTESGDTPRFWERAHPEVVNRILAAQSTDVDVVSGATYSSMGIINSVKDALSKADLPVTVDKAALQALVEQASALAEADYTADSWAGFAQALAAANEVLADEATDQAAVDAGAAGLRTAMDALVANAPTEPKEALNALIARVEAMDSDLYTRTTWSALSRPLDTAKTVSANGEATADEIRSALEALEAAVDGLVEYVPGDKHASTLDELKALAPDMRDGETLYIDNDIDAVTSATLNTYSNFTIDGQGHTLDGQNEHGFVYVRGGELSIKNTVFKDAVQFGRGGTPITGAAVYARGGNVNMENCAVVGNQSRQGAVYVGGNRTLNMVNCTLVGNTATGSGAAIYAGNGAAVTLANSIALGDGANDVYLSETATLVDGGYNLVARYGGLAAEWADTTVVDESLADHAAWMDANGMLTGAPNHPAINRIPADNAYLPATDLSGRLRPQEEKGDIGCYEADPVAVESVKIINGSLVALSRSKTLQLNAQCAPANATMQDVSWTSLNTAVATVDAQGVVTPKKAGTAVIVATTANGETSQIVLRVTN